ncbi:trypsin-like peptidase domain-containing protein [Nitrospira sp. Nam80]
MRTLSEGGQSPSVVQLSFRWLAMGLSFIGLAAAFLTTVSEAVNASEIQTGSGFYVSKEGHLLTNDHVIESCGRIEVELGGIRRKVQLIASDTNNDIALLLDNAQPRTVAVFRDGKMIRAGSDVIILGYPLHGALAHEAIVTTGTISALAGMMNNAATFQLSAPTQPGNSGGPVLDASGTVVGMMYGMLDSIKGTKMSGQVPQNVNFAIHSAVVRSFLEAHGVPYVSRLSGPVRDRADVVEEARRYTVLIHCFAPEKEPSDEFAQNILLKVFDREAPGWRQIDLSDYEKWLKSQPLAYQKALKATRDPYMWAGALNDFMSSRPNTPSSKGSESNNIMKDVQDPHASNTTTAQSIEEYEPYPNENSQRYPSFSEELDPELKELKPIQAPPTVKLPEAVRETKPMFREPPVRQAPVQQQPPPVSASVPKISKTPFTKMNVPESSGSNTYLALVQRAINEKWTAPPVDISGAALTVVIKFRLSRNGVISGVAITQQSGNDYYDLAARRAVLSVDRLPTFPSDITEQFYDILYTFAVGGGP